MKLSVQPFSLYLSSWEHLYLLPRPAGPTGLPNQLFANHPWALVLFERVYCDENGLNGEANAANAMGWVTSKLFVQLHDAGILEPVRAERELRQLDLTYLKRKFENEYQISVEEALGSERFLEDIFDRWRRQIVARFVKENHLVLYDWKLTSLRHSPTDVLVINGAPVIPLARTPTDLSDSVRDIFFDLQEFERPYLRSLRAGQMPQAEYLRIIAERRDDYRKVDKELECGLAENLELILTLRKEFSQLGGWDAIREVGAGNQSAIDVLQRRVSECFGNTVERFGGTECGVGKARYPNNGWRAPKNFDYFWALPSTRNVMQAEKVPVGDKVSAILGTSRGSSGSSAGRGGSENFQGGERSSMVNDNRAPQWRASLAHYHPRDRVAVKFKRKSWVTFTELLWRELYGLPCALLGDKSIIAPRDAIAVFQQYALKFNEIPRITADELPDDELHRRNSESPRPLP